MALTEFINNLRWQAGKGIYVWAQNGTELSDITEAEIKACETSTANASKAIKLWKERKHIKGARAFDCSGLGIYMLRVDKKIGITYDTTADGLMHKCKMISKNDLRRGCWVFKVYSSGEKQGKAYHIGYVVDDNLNVVEAQGRAYGVVERPLSAGGWNAYGLPTFYEDEIERVSSWIVRRNLKRGCDGSDVRALQEALIKAGYSVGSTGADGDFGKNTQKAVINYQSDHRLFVDGIAGKNTIRSLGGIFE